MSSEIQDIEFGVASQTLFFDASSRPASITSVEVFENSDGDDSTAELATTGSASVEANPSTTLNGAAGASQANPKLIALSSALGLTKGRRYLVTGTALASEWIEAERIDTSVLVDVYAKHPLHNDYETGSSFVSTRISISVLDAWAADDNNISGAGYDGNSRYRVRWIWVDGLGASHVADTYFDLVRYAGQHNVTVLDVDRYFPGFKDKLPTDERASAGEDLINEAHKLVKIDLAAAGKADQLARNREVMDEMVKRATVFLWAQARALNGVGELSEYEIAEKQYYTRLDQLIRVTAKIPFSTDSSGAAVKVEGSPIWQR